MAGLARVVLFGLNNAASVGCTPGYEALGAAYLPARSCRSGWSDVRRPRGWAAAEQSRVWFFFSAVGVRRLSSARVRVYQQAGEKKPSCSPLRRVQSARQGVGSGSLRHPAGWPN